MFLNIGLVLSPVVIRTQSVSDVNLGPLGAVVRAPRKCMHRNFTGRAFTQIFMTGAIMVMTMLAKVDILTHIISGTYSHGVPTTPDIQTNLCSFPNIPIMITPFPTIT